MRNGEVPLSRNPRIPGPSSKKTTVTLPPPVFATRKKAGAPKSPGSVVSWGVVFSLKSSGGDYQKEETLPGCFVRHNAPASGYTLPPLA